ncbi:MAG: TIGR04283 family arsenosugar biosynthesis glycosyltransferase [Pseudohongiellaceae bacterium]
MKKLSIIIPVFNEQKCIVARLNAFQKLRESNCEVVLVDGGSADRTVDLATPLVDKLVHSSPGRAVQMNRGAELATGNIFLFLHIDTTLPKAANELITNLVEEKSSVWGWFNLQFDNPALSFKIIGRSMNIRAALTWVCTGDQTLFVTRNLFESIRGFPEIPLMEDVAITKLLRRISKPKIVSSKVTTSARRWEQNGVIKTVFFMWRLRLLYFFGTSPIKLAHRYYPMSAEHRDKADSPSPKEASFRYPNARILLFVKAPFLGQVKTRLEPLLGSEKCLELHRAMGQRIAGLLSSIKLAPWQLWVSADESNEFFLGICNREDIHLQIGSSLGEKIAGSMENALLRPGVDGVIVIGSDCPSYDAAYLESAMHQLYAGHDIVLGPAEDGGYVLIGMRASNPGVFNGVEWGTDRVLEQTISNIDTLDLSHALIETLWDVDRPEDLDRLQNLDPPLSWEST